MFQEQFYTAGRNYLLRMCNGKLYCRMFFNKARKKSRSGGLFKFVHCPCRSPEKIIKISEYALLWKNSAFSRKIVSTVGEVRYFLVSSQRNTLCASHFCSTFPLLLCTVCVDIVFLFVLILPPSHGFPGLNLMSQFNLENQTHFNTKADEYDKMRKLVCFWRLVKFILQIIGGNCDFYNWGFLMPTEYMYGHWTGRANGYRRRWNGWNSSKVSASRETDTALWIDSINSERDVCFLESFVFLCLVCYHFMLLFLQFNPDRLWTVQEVLVSSRLLQKTYSVLRQRCLEGIHNGKFVGWQKGNETALIHVDVLFSCVLLNYDHVFFAFSIQKMFSTVSRVTSWKT